MRLGWAVVATVTSYAWGYRKGFQAGLAASGAGLLQSAAKSIGKLANKIENLGREEK